MEMEKKLKLIKELINIGNQSKNNDQYTLSNMCFVEIIDLLDDLGFSDKYDIPNIKNVSLIYETANHDFNVYYDLLNIKIKKSSLCIPVPLLKPEVLSTFHHHFKYVERNVHNRDIKTFNDPIINKKLYRNFLRLIRKYDNTDHHYIYGLMTKYLTDGDAIFKKLIYDDEWIHEIDLYNKRHRNDRTSHYVTIYDDDDDDD